LSQMQAALGLGKPGPASGALVFAQTNRASAMRAANTGKILIMKRVVRNVVLDQVTPDLSRTPVRDWVDLDETKRLVPCDFRAGGARGRLIPAYARVAAWVFRLSSGQKQMLEG